MEHGLRGTVVGIDPRQISQTAVECKGERALIETMGITTDRLDRIEQKIGELKNCVFGPEPELDSARASIESNVRSLAGHAFDSTVRLERVLDEIIGRLSGSN